VALPTEIVKKTIENGEVIETGNARMTEIENARMTETGNARVIETGSVRVIETRSVRVIEVGISHVFPCPWPGNDHTSGEEKRAADMASGEKNRPQIVPEGVSDVHTFLSHLAWAAANERTLFSVVLLTRSGLPHQAVLHAYAQWRLLHLQDHGK
jgi:hypothetical protein